MSDMVLYILLYKNDRIVCISEEIDYIYKFYNQNEYNGNPLYSIKKLNNTQSEIISQMYNDLEVTPCFECLTTFLDMTIMYDPTVYSMTYYKDYIHILEYEELLDNSLKVTNKDLYKINKSFYDKVKNDVLHETLSYYKNTDYMLQLRRIYHNPYEL